MPAAVSFNSNNNGAMFPALYLYPLNDSFIPKHISLPAGQRVKIGRQTNAKTVPAERNGYFDSKVLSRQHAEVWEEGGKIYIKDVKSSNGTFINGERLSQEGLESDPFELKTDDIVEFGIDIVGEDNRTIVHHKVAARVLCVFNEQDAQSAARAEQASGASGSGLGGQPANGAFNFAGGQGPGGSQRRPTLQQQGLGGMGGMGGSMRPPGKSTLTFDHILSRLQSELQKSRETGAELHSLTGAMGEIHDTLGGGSVPSALPTHPQALPPVRPPQENGAYSPEPQQAPAGSDVALRQLQDQLHDVQSSMADHISSLRQLEGMLAEHETIKRELLTVKERMEETERHRAQQEQLMRHVSPSRRGQYEISRHAHEENDSDDDDARSVSTVVPHDLERVDEEDEDQLAQDEEDEERRRRREELGRPRTPEPTGMGEDEDEVAAERRLLSSTQRSRSPSPSRRPASYVIPDDLTQRMTTLSNQLESALELSRSLQAQHATAQMTIATLESKVSALESLVETTQAQVQTQAQAQEAARVQAAEAARIPAEERAWERESLTEMLNEWKKGVEGQWTGVQEEWHEERDRLRRAREEWEVRFKSVEEGVGSAVGKIDTGLATFAVWQSQQKQHPRANGDASASGGLVTPPSPRSLSSDSLRSRQRRKRSSSSRGRSRSGSRHGTGTGPSTSDQSLAVAGRAVNGVSHASSTKSRKRSPWVADESSDSEAALHSTLEKDVKPDVAGLFPTPESSVLRQRLTSVKKEPDEEDSKEALRKASQISSEPDLHMTYLSTAVGVLVVSAAAAAVLYRIGIKAE